MNRGLSITNLAWPVGADDLLIPTLRECGARGVEIAPTRYGAWQDLDTATLLKCRARFADAGIDITSLQAILFGVDDALLLGSHAQYVRMKSHLERVADVAALLGAGCVVFGAPKLRRREQVPEAQALPLAIERMRGLGDCFSLLGLRMVIEPAPRFYGGDFLTTGGQVIDFVSRVSHPGIGVHLDTGCAAVEQDDISSAIRLAGPNLCHFHVSEPRLAGFELPTAQHGAASAALVSMTYAGWIVVEMLSQGEEELCVERVRTALEFARATYWNAANDRQSMPAFGLPT